MNTWDKIRTDILKKTPMANKLQRFKAWLSNYRDCTEVTETYELPDGTFMQTYVTIGFFEDARVLYWGRLP